MEDGCPGQERSEFVEFAAKEIEECSARLESEKLAWPPETDCDRLDRVEAALRDRGILLWQVSPCCNTCTLNELPDRITDIAQRFPEFRKRARGYAYFVEQNMPEELSENTQVSVYLGYGWLSPKGSQVSEEEFEKNSLSIAREISECLREERFEILWDGDFANKIRLSLNWQRRKMLD